MNTVIYLSYGTGPHEAEVIFSMLTAWRWAAPGDTGVTFVIYTDHPESYAGLPVEIEFISPEKWREWAGPTDFQHRRKIFALQHALRSRRAPTVLMDGDTWWRKPPAKLFERIGPGRSVLHLREGEIGAIRTPVFEAMAEFLREREFSGPDGGTTTFPLSSAMWNAGVIGLAPEDASLLEEVIHWTDAFCEHSDLHFLEQFAFSHVLARETELREAGDIVFHYWPPYLHEPFRERLPGIMEESAGKPLCERAKWCYARRPRPTVPRRGKVVLKRALQAAGLIKGRARSNEW